MTVPDQATTIRELLTHTHGNTVLNAARSGCRECKALTELAALEARLANTEQALRRAARVAENLLGQVDEFTGVIGPGGEREDVYIRDRLGREIQEWAVLAGSPAEEPTP